jgi:hypothetical protein
MALCGDLAFGQAADLSQDIDLIVAECFYIEAKKTYSLKCKEPKLCCPHKYFISANNETHAACSSEKSCYTHTKKTQNRIL